MSLTEIYKFLLTGCNVYSSGTTGAPKEIFRSPENLRLCNLAAIDSQEITKKSNILTVCKMDHAGGLLAQTLPALSVGANVTIKKFNAFSFFTELLNGKYTHTHLTPTHCQILMKTKTWKNIDLNGIWITCGSDPVSWNIIEEFIDKRCVFMANWGMSEVGPCAINSVFRTKDDINAFKMKSRNTILGNRFYCDTKILNEQLHIKGDISIYDDWLATGDLVENKEEVYYYIGRL